MEELNLGDLEFDTSGFQLFDDEPNPASEELIASVEEIESNENNEEKNIENISADSDDNVDTGQESVANQDEGTNQVQVGKTTDGEGGDSSSPKMNENEQLYSKLAAEFKTKGVLPELDINKIKSLDDIENAIKERIENGLTDRQKAIEEAQKAGAPVDKVSEISGTIASLRKITPEYISNPDNVKFRVTAIMQDAMSKGYDRERAESIANRSVEAGTDIEDAEFALSSIIKQEEDSLNKIMDDVKSKEQGALNDIKDYISSNEEIIPGIKLSESQGNELYDQITTDLGGKDNAFMKAQKADPIGSRIKLETFFYLTKGFTDFSVFRESAETKVSSDLENLIKGASFTDSGRINTSSTDPNANFLLRDLKDLEIE